VGPKLGVRLLTELREKAGAMPSGPAVPMGGVVAPGGGLAADALSALANLGYRRLEAHPVVGRVIEGLGEGATLDAVIRGALRELAR
jgi:Holliday junction DNA helicase RuvA